MDVIPAFMFGRKAGFFCTKGNRWRIKSRPQEVGLILHYARVGYPCILLSGKRLRKWFRPLVSTLRTIYLCDPTRGYGTIRRCSGVRVLTNGLFCKDIQRSILESFSINR